MSFSVPRWSSPICGSTRVTTSPSSSRTRRKTPWAAGCCGPKLMVKGRTSDSVSAIGVRLRCGEGGEHFGARELLRRVGEGVLPRLLVDEDLVREHEPFLVVEGLEGDEVEAGLDQAIEKRRSARDAVAALGPRRRPIETEAALVLDD